jgi:LuxR family transcriptional regulator, maltose regulon positive regulatory protein
MVWREDSACYSYFTLPVTCVIRASVLWWTGHSSTPSNRCVASIGGAREYWAVSQECFRWDETATTIGSGIMMSQLLITKVHIPPQARHLVHRSHLVETLERETPNHNLVLVSAPAGYGKTTLLSQWAWTSCFPIAWFSIGEGDNDPDRFLRYLLSAWEQIHPEVLESGLAVPLGARSPDHDAVLTAFINLATSIGDHSVIVLDDYHLITDAAVHRIMAFLLDHLPPTNHIVIASRGEPPLPMARYRARGKLLELGVDDLRFLPRETSDFVNRVMGLGLEQETTARLHSGLEGWIAGLQLASLAMQRRGDAEAAELQIPSGRHRFIIDYLSQEVLSRLPADILTFLLQTSILDQVSGPLCSAVTMTQDGQVMLERLERDHLFLVPLDDTREWYRYHQVFRDALLLELERHHSAELAALHRRAAGWYLEHGLADNAFHHAVAAGDLQLIIHICEQHVFVKLHAGELTQVQKWLDALPRGWDKAHPIFGLARAALMAFTGALDACVHCINDVERQFATGNDAVAKTYLARVTAMRCFVACFSNDLVAAETHASRALRDLPADDLVFRADIHHALGDTYRRWGRWEDAKASYQQVLSYAHAPSFRLLSVHVYGALADLELRQGHLRHARSNWQQAVAAIEERENWGRFPLPVIGWVYIRLGELLYEHNEFGEARDHLVRGLERAEFGGDVRARIAGYLLLGRLRLTEGDIATAIELLECARPMVTQAAFPEWESRFTRLQLEFWLARGNRRSAMRWAETLLQDCDFESPAEDEAARLGALRVVVTMGDRLARERALRTLDAVLGLAMVQGRLGIQIEGLAVQALGYWQSGDRARAMTTLEHALRLAEAEGYVRLFADLGLPMVRLLQEARSRQVMPDYVQALLEASGAGGELLGTAHPAVLEPLTNREQQILELIAAGLKNHEIAEALAISSETVKKHTSSIYGKLDVRGRVEAVARARALDLLRQGSSSVPHT